MFFMMLILALQTGLSFSDVRLATINDRAHILAVAYGFDFRILDAGRRAPQARPERHRSPSRKIARGCVFNEVAE